MKDFVMGFALIFGNVFIYWLLFSDSKYKTILWSLIEFFIGGIWLLLVMIGQLNALVSVIPLALLLGIFHVLKKLFIKDIPIEHSTNQRP
jgi:hypothetical protein